MKLVTQFETWSVGLLYAETIGWKKLLGLLTL